MTTQEAWAERLKLRAEGNKLHAEGDRLYAEGYKLIAEGDKLIAEGDLVFIKAIIAEYGNIGLDWKNYNKKHNSCECHLANGVVFGFKK